MYHAAHLIHFQMVWSSYIYYLSKFSEFIDTFCFVARKKFNHIRKDSCVSSDTNEGQHAFIKLDAI